MVLNDDFGLLHLTYTFLLLKQIEQTLIRHHFLRVWFASALSAGPKDPSLGFTENILMSQRKEYRDYKYPLLGVRSTRGMITLVSYNHVDNSL